MPCRTQSVLWASLSRIRAGMGNCMLAMPDTFQELQEALREHPEAPVLGNGSNLLGKDDDSCAIRLSLHGQFGEIRQNGAFFTVGAAVPLALFLRRAAELGYGGYAQLAGIPGTMGGAVMMNAGALGKEIGTAVRELEGLDRATQTPWLATPLQMEWSYRTSPVPKGVVLTSVTLELIPAAPEKELLAIGQELQRRKQVTPEGASCGSVFRNPSPEIPAGRLLEQAGCKGLAIGPFSVSQRHANWIVNLSRTPGPTALCLRLMRQCQDAVLEQTGTLLLPEWVVLP